MIMTITGIRLAFLLNYHDDIGACLLILLAVLSSEISMSQNVIPDHMEHAKSAYPSLGLGNSFSFKFKDQKGRLHRINFGKGVELVCQSCLASSNSCGALICVWIKYLKCSAIEYGPWHHLA